MNYPNFLYIFSVLLFSNAAFASRVSFGEKCSRNLRCESKNFLTCSPTESTCVCLMPDSMTYEETSGKCVALAGERCQYTALEGERTWNDQIPCISNANCNNGICECTSNYFEVANGTCQLKKNFGDNCSSNSMCSTLKHLTCGPDQTCICADNRVSSGDVCSLKVGEKCSRYDKDSYQCTQMSHCSRSSSSDYQCTCETGYFPSSTGHCERKRTYGMACTNNSQCHDDSSFICNQITKTCDCNIGFGYHPKDLYCKTSPNAGGCYDDSNCVSNAKCYAVRYNKHCHCKPGSIAFNGYCLIAENNRCNDEVSIDNLDVSVNGQTTDKACLPGLVCRNSMCSCLYKDHQVYNESGNNLCESLVSGPCNNSDDCVRNSECLTNQAGLMECQCMEGFIQAGRRCDIGYGRKCKQGDMKSRCDRYGPLECSVRRICECSEFQVYDNSTMKCKGLAGAKCGTRELAHSPVLGLGSQSESGNFCVDGATCKSFRGVDYGVCACEDGKVLQSDRTCVLVGESLSSEGFVF